MYRGVVGAAEFGLDTEPIENISYVTSYIFANLSKNAVVSESHWMSAPPSQVKYNSARVVQQQC